MEPLSRRERKELRELAGIAWERELAGALATLEDQFRAWRAGQLSPFALSEAIHKYHNGAARDLYVFYAGGHPEPCVARAIAAGLLARAEVSADLLRKLGTLVEFFETQAAEAASRAPAI